MKPSSLLMSSLVCFALLPILGNAQSKTQVVSKLVRHSLSSAQLSKLNGKMYWDKEAKAALTPALKQLLGSKWAEFDKSFHTSTPMIYKNGALHGSGFRGMNGAALEFKDNGIAVAALKEAGTCTDFGEVNPGYLCEEIDR